MIGIATTITSPAFLLQKNHSFCLLLLFILCHCIIPSLSVPLGQERRNFAPCWPCRYVDYHYNEIGYLFAACNLYESLYSSPSLSLYLSSPNKRSLPEICAWVGLGFLLYTSTRKALLAHNGLCGWGSRSFILRLFVVRVYTSLYTFHQPYLWQLGRYCSISLSP